MPQPSIFTPCGLFELAGETPIAEQIYDEIVAAYGPAFDFTPGPTNYMEAKAYATAMALARAGNAAVRAGNQRHPSRCWDMLLLLARDFDVIPSATDTIPSLQAKISAAKLLSQGARFDAVVAGLAAILGSNFLSYRPLLTSEATAYPTWPSATARIKAKPSLTDPGVKFCALVDPVGGAGTFTVSYTNLDPTAGEVDLAAGDVVMVDPENSAVSERVTITGTVGQGSEKNPPALAYWTTTTAFAVGALSEPVPANGFAYACTTAGTTSSAQPVTWPTMPGMRVTDGTVVWTCTGGRTALASGDLANPAPWTRSTGTLIGTITQPTTANALYYSCTTAGVTAGAEPTWPTEKGDSVQDGSVVWLCEGFIGAARQFTATFRYAHDVGAPVTTMSWPYQWSTQRFSLVIVKASAAVDPETRRQVNAFMAKAMRGVSMWAIVEAASQTALGGTVGPFAFDASPLGAVPMGTLSFTNVPV